MKYFIIRNKSDVESRLNVFNSYGDELFIILGETSGSSHKLTVSDITGKMLVSITSAPFAFPYFRVKFGERHIVFIMTPNRKTPMIIYGAHTKFDGVLLTGEYTLKNSNNEIVAFQKHSWCKMGECHELEVFDENYLLLALAVSSAISIYYGIYSDNGTVPI